MTISPRSVCLRHQPYDHLLLSLRPKDVIATFNAITHLTAAVAKLGTFQMPMRLNETTRAFFRPLAAISAPEEAYLYTHLEDPKESA